MSRIAVIGTGAWGTALALHAIRIGHHVTLIARDLATTFIISEDRATYRLPGHHLPEALEVRHEIPANADLLLWVVPTQQLRSSLLSLRPGRQPIVACAKGIEVGTNLLPLEVISEILPGHQVAILTGPTFAHEVASGLPAAAVVACGDSELRERVCLMLGTNTFRIYGNPDALGAQLGGAAKNVIAIAAGAVIGAGLGENARAAVVTRGLNELRVLAVALGGYGETVMGLSGLGDLLLTCTGSSSRNFRLGHALGQGVSLSDSLARFPGVVEGVTTAAPLVCRAKDVDMPICRAVADLLSGTKTLDQITMQLLSRPQRDE